jgi:FAD synthetase
MINPHATTRIMVFGTFDTLHPGHLDFFQQARALAENPYLIVSIARDANVLKIKQRLPDNPELQRLTAVKMCKLVDEAILGNQTGYLEHIKRLRPDIIALGYDQTAYTTSLPEDLQAAGLATTIVRLQAHRPEIYKTSIIKSRQQTEEKL